MSNPGRIIIGVMVIVAFIVLKISPTIAKEGTQISNALNSVYISHPFFLIIAVIVGFGLIFSGLKM